MSDRDSAEIGMASLKAFEEAKATLLQSLSEVEATISRNQEIRGAILKALGDIGVTEADTPERPSDKRTSQRRGRKTEPKAAPEAVDEPPAVVGATSTPEPVVEHLPSSETQEKVAAEAEAEGDDPTEALDDWTPGESVSSTEANTYDELDIDEVKF